MNARVVYFLQGEPSGPIKIGWTSNLAQRIGYIRSASRMPNASVLGTIYGDSRLERALHLLFAGDRLTGEWFAPSARLLAFINTIPLWAPRQPHVEQPDPVALARRRRKTFKPVATGNGPLPVPPGTLNCGAARLISWLTSSGAAQTVFAGLFSPPVQQSLVSKWKRGVTIPSKRMRRAIEMVTGGAVVWEPSDRKVAKQ